jgi:hypothetical protein
VADLVRLAGQSRAIYHRHPGCSTSRPPGAFPAERHCLYRARLAVLAGTDLSGPTRLETIGLI